MKSISLLLFFRGTGFPPAIPIFGLISFEQRISMVSCLGIVSALSRTKILLFAFFRKTFIA